ncbi:hypothetical protein OEA41_010620 [Lepraria neglecta]|uniref:Uncharacterized protein n=1 Tax=Lepraria neglecta TaxID=209136 RepID=A0AAD9YZC3_9LECA|nr:hypothetical protein OEA41_010620 [Lepraria neglecta]
MEPVEDPTNLDNEVKQKPVNPSSPPRETLGFQPLSDLKATHPTSRNSWSQPSQPPAQPSPITPSKPSTRINIPTNNLPPTPETTPVRSLKRTYNTALEGRLPGPDAAVIEATSPSVQAGKRRMIRVQDAAVQPSFQTTSSQSQTPDKTISPSLRYNKRRTTHLSHIATAVQSLPTPSQSPSRSPFRSDLTPRFSKNYKPKAEPLSWQELNRMAESVLRQVDWAEVAEDVASNRSSIVYKRAVKEILERRIKEMDETKESES